MNRLSVVLATRNEEKNIERCLASIKGIAWEIIVVDEYSSDKTRELAQNVGAKVFLEKHNNIFHITKQVAIKKASGDWILQLDADEVVSPDLLTEIKNLLNGFPVPAKNPKTQKLFERHQKLLEERDGKIGNDIGEVVAYFIPRINMFLGKPLVHAGVYPDGVIRLFKRGKAYLPGKSVHEQMKIEGRVGWLENNLLHYDSPTLSRYLSRLNRYTDLMAEDYKQQKLSKNIFTIINFCLIKPVITFVSLYFRHKGFMDGARGFLWSFFSASRFLISYFKYLTQK